MKIKLTDTSFTDGHCLFENCYSFSHHLFCVQVPIKRTKHFELGGEKKRKGQMIQF